MTANLEILLIPYEKVYYPVIETIEEKPAIETSLSTFPQGVHLAGVGNKQRSICQNLIGI
jgi:hypothetical protein